MQLWPRFLPHNGCFIKYSKLAVEPPPPLCCSPSGSWTDGFCVLRNSSSFAAALIVRDVISSSALTFLDVWRLPQNFIIPAFQRKPLQTPLLILTFVSFTLRFGKHCLDKQATLLFSWQKCGETSQWFRDKDLGERSSSGKCAAFTVSPALKSKTNWLPPFTIRHIVQLHYNCCCFNS